MINFRAIREYLITKWDNNSHRDVTHTTKPQALRNYLLDLSDGGGDYRNLGFLVRIRLAVSGLMIKEALCAMEEIVQEIDYWNHKGGETSGSKAGKLRVLWKSLAVFIGRIKVLIDDIEQLDEKKGVLERGESEERRNRTEKRLKDSLRTSMTVLGKLSKDFDKALYAGGSGQVAMDIVDAVKASGHTQDSRRELVFWTSHAEIHQERIIVEDLLYELNVLPLVCALIRNAVRPLARPWRTKFKYTEATLAILAGGAYLVTKSSHFGGSGELEKWISDTCYSLKRFLSEHVAQPSFAIYDKIFRNTAVVSTSASADSLAGERASLQRMIEDFASTHYGDEETLQLARQGNMMPVLKIYEQEVKHPIRNIAMGSILRALLIQVQSLKTNVEQLMTSANHQIYLNEINLQMLALFPAALVAVGTVYGVSALISRFFSGRSRSYAASVYEMARIRMRDIHVTLVHSMEVSKPREPTEASSEQEDEKQDIVAASEMVVLKESVTYLEALGSTLAKVDALEQLLPRRGLRLSSWSREKLREDLGLLKSSLLSNAQKLRIVDGMYSAYPVLR